MYPTRSLVVAPRWRARITGRSIRLLRERRRPTIPNAKFTRDEADSDCSKRRLAARDTTCARMRPKSASTTATAPIGSARCGSDIRADIQHQRSTAGAGRVAGRAMTCARRPGWDDARAGAGQTKAGQSEMRRETWGSGLKGPLCVSDTTTCQTVQGANASRPDRGRRGVARRQPEQRQPAAR